MTSAILGQRAGGLAPALPRELRLAGVEGSAAVLVFLHDGFYRGDSVVSASHEEFGRAVQRAVGQWSLASVAAAAGTGARPDEIRGVVRACRARPRSCRGAGRP